MSVNVYGFEAPPDLRKDLRKWFRYYDTDDKGLNQTQVLDALTHTLSITTPSEKQDLRSSLAVLWPLFDPDSSGKISCDEFCSPGLLGEAILAQLQEMDKERNKNKKTPNQSLTELQAMFPSTSLSAIEQAFSAANGDQEKAVNALLSSLPLPPLPPPPHVTMSAPIRDSTRQEFKCGHCKSLFAISSNCLPRGFSCRHCLPDLRSEESRAYVYAATIHSTANRRDSFWRYTW